LKGVGGSPLEPQVSRVRLKRGLLLERFEERAERVTRVSVDVGGGLI
jgi:hypothetical protein